MIGPSRLAPFSILTICSLTRALVLSNLNISSPSGPDSQEGSNLTAAVNAALHCTTDPNWLIPAFPRFSTYDLMCQAAMEKAKTDLMSFDMGTEYEFLERGATAQTTRPKIELPRKYVAAIRGKGPNLPSCTVAIVMIQSLAAGDPLPDEPPGPFGESDILTPSELVYYPGSIGNLFYQCLRAPSLPQIPSLGWTQVGRAGNIGIFYVGTRSVMDRRIPRALHPNGVEEE